MALIIHIAGILSRPFSIVMDYYRWEGRERGKPMNHSLWFEHFQSVNRMKMFIQGKKRNLVMQAYLGDYDIHWRDSHAFCVARRLNHQRHPRQFRQKGDG